jgi:hypothetical protein
MIDAFRLMGALGILLIAMGIIVRERRRQDTFYVAGGVCLETYSIYIGDAIFIVLQLIFTAAAVYDLLRNRRARA